MTPSNPEYRTIPLTQNQVTIVDAIEYEKYSVYEWFAMWDPSIQGFYAGRNSECVDGKRTTIYLAREILGLKPGDGLIAHHVNHDTLNNTHENLMAVTDSPSTMSRKTFSNSTSGCKGVNYKKNATGPKKWVARIQANGVRKWLGYFTTKEEASAAYWKAAEELHGKYVYGS